VADLTGETGGAGDRSAAGDQTCTDTDLAGDVDEIVDAAPHPA
jgi:hypothetical protein